MGRVVWPLRETVRSIESRSRINWELLDKAGEFASPYSKSVIKCGLTSSICPFAGVDLS